LPAPNNQEFKMKANSSETDKYNSTDATGGDRS